MIAFQVPDPTVLRAVGFNIKWLLRMSARKGIGPLFLSRVIAWMRRQIEHLMLLIGSSGDSVDLMGGLPWQNS